MSEPESIALTGTFNTADTGPSRVLEGFSGALADVGYDVYAFTHGDRDSHPHPSVSVRAFSETPNSIRDFISYFRWVRTRVRELDPDILHPLEEYPFPSSIRTVQWTSDSYERWRLCRDDFRGYGYFAGDLVLNLANRIGATLTDTVVASSPETAKQMRSYWRLSPDTTIPLGIDREIRTPPSEPSNPARILLPGRITPKKGQVEFLSELDPDSSEYSVDIVGGVSDETYWERVPEWHANHHGFVSRDALLELYRNADIVAIPAVHENFSMTALEAIAHGCVVVITSRCGFAQLPEARSSEGVHVTREASTAATKTEELAREAILNRMMETTYSLSERFTWGQAAKNYIRIYKEYF